MAMNLMSCPMCGRVASVLPSHLWEVHCPQNHTTTTRGGGVRYIAYTLMRGFAVWR